MAVSRRELPRNVVQLTQLPRGARPIPFAQLELWEVTGTRALDCPTYGECLEFVSRVRWRGFSCRRCPRKCAQARAQEAQASQEPAPVILLH